MKRGTFESILSYEASLARAKEAENAGNYLAIVESLQPFVDSGDITPEGMYLLLLGLARSGASTHALAYLRLFVDKLPESEEAFALQARILKNRFREATDPEQKQLYGSRARDSYELLSEKTGGTYPAINAATLSLLLGDTERATTRAQWVLSRLAAQPRDYWWEVTRAEALLILGAEEEARNSLLAAAHDFEPGVAQRSTTYQQLALIADYFHFDDSLLAPVRAPACIHYTGHMAERMGHSGGIATHLHEGIRRQVEEILERYRVGFAFGALASGSDIIVAEATLDRGAELHLVLPLPAKTFVKVSVASGGKEWEDRFHQIVSKASSITVLVEGRLHDDDVLFAGASQLAMGLAVLRARMLGSAVVQCAIWNGKNSVAECGTGYDVKKWREYGFHSEVIEIETKVPSPHDLAQQVQQKTSETDASTVPYARAVRAMIFADVHGFSRLTDSILPGFFEFWVTKLGALIEQAKDDILIVNTWGDAVFAVFNDVCAAARFGTALASVFRRINVKTPHRLGVRVSAHAGPIFLVEDPVLKRPNAFGSEVNRTARMEPCTPLNSVYVTEEFAALLALRGDDHFLCEYAGEHALPKNFGIFRMYHLLSREDLGESVI